MVIADGAFMAAYYSELTRKEWLDAGANWRRAKREARKVLNGSWREYQAERLDGMAGLYPPKEPIAIDRSAFSWWKTA
jgi:hypothetical protein